MRLSVGPSMKRLGLAVAAALAAAVAATVVFDGAERERAQERPPPPTAASDAARSPAVRDRVLARSSDVLDDASGTDAASGDSDALAEAPDNHAVPVDAMAAGAPPSDGHAPSRAEPGRDTAVATAPPGPPAAPPAEPGRREPDKPAAAPREATARALDAETDAEQARRLNREGIALINAGRPRQAIAPLERAAELQPRDAEILDNLGDAYMLVGEHLVASRHFMRALDVAPTRAETWINLGRTRAELGQRESAVHAVVMGYRYSTDKAAVRAALLAAATGPQYSPQWREAAGLALARIDDGSGPPRS